MSEQEQRITAEASIIDILIVGGANTGRSPIAVAFLRTMLSARGLDWIVESAGVTGHDDEYAEPEACSAMYSLGQDITHHSARSLTANLIAASRMLLAIDSSIVHVIRMIHPDAVERMTTLGALAGRQRDIPDPFRMNVATWISYAREIEHLLHDGLERLIVLVQAFQAGQSPSLSNLDRLDLPRPGTATPAPVAPPPTDHLPPDPQRTAAVQHCERLLSVIGDMPDLVDWDKARQQLDHDLTIIATRSLGSNDLILPYTNMLRALLAICDTQPTDTPLAHLTHAVRQMQAPVGQDALTDLSGILAGWRQPPH